MFCISEHLYLDTKMTFSLFSEALRPVLSNFEDTFSKRACKKIKWMRQAVVNTILLNLEKP